AESDAGALFSNASAEGHVRVQDLTLVSLSGLVIGDTVTLTSRHDGVKLRSSADADADGLYGDGDATSETDYESNSKIAAADGAVVRAGTATITAWQALDDWNRDASADSGALGDDDHDETGD